mgnify:CR=1 FL=1
MLIPKRTKYRKQHRPDRHGIRGALTGTHSGAEGVLGQRAIREDRDPHLATTLDVTRHGDTGGLDPPSAPWPARCSARQPAEPGEDRCRPAGHAVRKLLGDALSDELGVDRRVLDFEDVELDLLAGEDDAIRKEMTKDLERAGVSRIIIERTRDRVRVDIHIPWWRQRP